MKIQFISRVPSWHWSSSARRLISMAAIERDTARLITQMQKAIAEANAFIDSMEN